MSTKKCTNCGQMKKFCEFGKHKQGKFGLRGRCKSCRSSIEGKTPKDAARKKEWYINNKPICLERAKKHYKDNREDKIRYQKSYAGENADKINEYQKKYREENKDKIKANRLSWAKNNADAKRASDRACERRRRAAKLKLNEQYSEADEQITRKIFSNRCFRCNSATDVHIDHHYPLSKGFALSIDNAVLLCKTCNSTKNAKMPEDFYSESEILEINELLKTANDLLNGDKNDQTDS